MLISVDQWRASIGIFYGHAYALIGKLTKLKLNNIEFFVSYFLPTILFLLLLFLLSLLEFSVFLFLSLMSEKQDSTISENIKFTGSLTKQFNLTDLSSCDKYH